MRVEDKKLDRNNTIAYWISVLLLAMAFTFMTVGFITSRMVDVLRIPIDLAASIVLAIINQ